MGVLAAVVDSLSAGEEATVNGDSFAYRCADCDAGFERPKRRMVRVRCPDCRSSDVRSAD